MLSPLTTHHSPLTNRHALDITTPAGHMPSLPKGGGHGPDAARAGSGALLFRRQLPAAPAGDVLALGRGVAGPAVGTAGQCLPGRPPSGTIRHHHPAPRHGFVCSSVVVEPHGPELARADAGRAAW